MSDRIVVMNSGRIEQVGNPKDIYYRPQTAFVAGFFGDNNLINGRMAPGALVETSLGRFQASTSALDIAIGAQVTAAIRPEKIRLNNGAQPGDVVIPAVVEDVVFVGAITQVLLRPDAAPDRTLTAKVTSDAGECNLAQGQSVEIKFRSIDVALIPERS